ncbi:TPA: DUF4145 domain-containing protein [Enterococcus faecalis]|nr:DUF4145 domain-containing protein [Enterococcus faecalis]HCT6554210.1 DUF4145 domain-containing protein [Enterococcus faecalis]
MSKFLCPFCNTYFVLNKSTFKTEEISSGIFLKDSVRVCDLTQSISNDRIKVKFFACPNCENTTVKLLGIGSQFKSKKLNFNPDSTAKVFPEYIPEAIRIDYEEACKIINLSPKASATLSRRCLQGMIRDYWGISGKNNLFEEINAISDKVTLQVKQVLDSVRQIGNIGAHMEKDINLIIDIDPDEAQQLINLIEYLMKEWYIQRHESELMLSSILEISQQKQTERKK